MPQSPPTSGISHRLARTPTPLLFAASIALAIGLLWWQGSLLELAPVVRGTSGPTIALGFALYALGLLILCWRWQNLLRISAPTTRFPAAAQAFLTSVVVNYAAPIGLALPARALLSARDLGLSAAASWSVAFWEVALDLMVLGTLSVVWVGLTGPAEVAGLVRGPVWIWPAAVTGGLLALFAVGWLLKRRPAIWSRVAAAGTRALRYPKADRTRFAFAVLLSVLFWAVQGMIIWLLLGAVGLESVASGQLLLGLLGPPIFLGMVSPVPGGAGVREALMVAVAATAGVNGGAVLVVAVAYRTALFVAIPVVFVVVRVVTGWVRRPG